MTVASLHDGETLPIPKIAKRVTALTRNVWYLCIYDPVSNKKMTLVLRLAWFKLMLTVWRQIRYHSTYAQYMSGIKQVLRIRQKGIANCLTSLWKCIIQPTKIKTLINTNFKSVLSTMLPSHIFWYDEWHKVWDLIILADLECFSNLKSQ